MEASDFNEKIIERLAIQNANLSLENVKLKILLEDLQSRVMEEDDA